MFFAPTFALLFLFPSPYETNNTKIHIAKRYNSPLIAPTFSFLFSFFIFFPFSIITLNMTNRPHVAHP